MNSVTLRDVLQVIQRTIYSVDNRLTNHGEQVAYLCLRMGREMGYSQEKLLSLCSLAMVHDIGAYKVEEQRRMTEFEVRFPHEHAVYGWQFLREFSPYADLADVILYHHWHYEDRHYSIPGKPVPTVSFLIHLADRVSVLYAHHGNDLKKVVQHNITGMAGTVFNPRHVALLMRLAEETDLMDSLLDGSYLDEVYSVTGQVALSSSEATSYLQMLVYAIDFRSRQTVAHSISVVSVAEWISRIMGMSPEDQAELSLAALLHDIGKMTTPIEVLAKPGRLTAEEMAVMQKHVTVTEEILKGMGIDRIRKIAASHHERLDGKGYPHGYTSHELDLPCRVLAVADVMAALVEPRYYKPALPKEEVLRIMAESALNRKSDPRVYKAMRSSYDVIAAEMLSNQTAMYNFHDDLSAEYDAVLNKIYELNNTHDKASTILRAAA